MKFFCMLEEDKTYEASAASDPRILYGATAMREFAQRRAKNELASMRSTHVTK